MDCLTNLFLHERPASTPVAIDKEGRIISWEKFLSDVSALSTRISKRIENRWALCFNDSYLFTASFVALGVAGKEIVVPSNITSQKALLVINDHFDALLSDFTPPVDCPVVIFTSEEIKTTTSKLSLKNVPVTLFTSGSTSHSKAIDKSISNFGSEIVVLIELFGEYFYGKDVFATVSHQHIYGLLFRALLPLAISVPFASYMLKYPDQVSRHSTDNRILISSPAILKRLEAEQVKNGYHRVFSSGGPLPYKAAQKCEELFGSLPLEVYGSSETGGIGWRQQSTNNAPWRPFPGIRVKCCDDERLQVRSPFLSQEGWFVTSDRVEFFSNGTFNLIDRTDRIIKISEKRISLYDVEERLKKIDGVLDAVVLPLETSKRLELGALICLSEDEFVNLNNQGKQSYTRRIKRLLADFVEPVGVPRRFRFVEEIPFNSQGKYEVQTLLGFFE